MKKLTALILCLCLLPSCAENPAQADAKLPAALDAPPAESASIPTETEPEPAPEDIQTEHKVAPVEWFDYYQLGGIPEGVAIPVTRSNDLLGKCFGLRDGRFMCTGGGDGLRYWRVNDRAVNAFLVDVNDDGYDELCVTEISGYGDDAHYTVSVHDLRNGNSASTHGWSIGDREADYFLMQDCDRLLLCEKPGGSACDAPIQAMYTFTLEAYDNPNSTHVLDGKTLTQNDPDNWKDYRIAETLTNGEPDNSTIHCAYMSDDYSDFAAITEYTDYYTAMPYAAGAGGGRYMAVSHTRPGEKTPYRVEFKKAAENGTFNDLNLFARSAEDDDKLGTVYSVAETAQGFAWLEFPGGGEWDDRSGLGGNLYCYDAESGNYALIASGVSRFRADADGHKLYYINGFRNDRFPIEDITLPGVLVHTF